MASRLNVPSGGEVVSLNRECHALTIAPSNFGKARSVIIPNLLTYPGPLVVIDPAGEYYAATARARAEMGPVLRLDPFRVIDQDTDSLDPLDLISLTGADIESDCQIVADLVSPRVPVNDFWEIDAFSLLSAVVGYVFVVPEKQKFADVITTFTSDDVVYNLAVVLDTIGKRLPQLSYQEIARFLQNSDADRLRILSTVTSRHKALLSQEVLKSLDKSSVPLVNIVEGQPLTAYLMIPPAKLRTHSTVLRIWLGTLLHCIISRRSVPANHTLFLLDECAQLDHFSVLETALTLCRGYGFQVWTFWDDLSQVRNLYPATWPTILKNCAAMQVFGDKDHAAAAEAATLLGIEPEDVLSLEPDEQVVRLDGVCHKIKKFDYLADPLFAGQFDQISPDAPRARD
jgi:type IV secretion system protein VirD4